MNALEITQLYKRYDNGFLAVKGIDLAVKQGDFLHCWVQMGRASQRLLVLSLR
jgi:ABC-type multidrug transport system, ATPase component